MNQVQDRDRSIHVQTHHVLVVEDDDGVREAVTFLLEDAGYVVGQEPDGARALERVRSSAEPLVVLLDLRMESMDGSQVLREALAQREVAERHAFILMTAATALPDGLPAVLRQLGGVVVAKPFEVDYLLAVVERAALRLPQ